MYLQVKDLKKSYGEGGSYIQVLKGVNTGVGQGEMCVIQGTSGSGKSTLLNCVGGLDLVDSGSIIVDGVEIVGMKPKQLSDYRRDKLGFIFQFYNLVPVLDVVENITLPVLMDRRSVNEERLLELLELLGLTGREKHLPNQLSGGQQQRVSIGRALMNAPAVVLADEPTGNLDSKNSREIMGLLRASNEKYKQTLIVITHDEEIALQAKRLIRIEDGKIVRDEVIRS